MNKARLMCVEAATRMNERTVPNLNPTLCASEVGKRLNLTAWELVKFQPRFMHRVGRTWAISEEELNALVDSGKDAEGGADFFRVIVWEPMAEVCARYLKKGRKVGITGKLRSRSYDAQDGSRRTVTEIIADEVEFLSAADSKPEEKTETTLPPELDGEDLPF